MKAILTEESAPVYSSAEDQAISIATIHKDEVMELGKVIRKRGGKVWVEITLPNDVKGYIVGGTKIFAVRNALIPRNPADLVEAPQKDARVVKTLVRNKIVTVYGVEKNDEGSWFKVTDEDGTQGYISTDAKLRVAPELSRSGARRNLITGLVFIFIGIVLSFMNGQSSQAGGIVYLAYAVVFFGLLQGGQGAVELYRVRKAEAKTKK